MTEPRWLETRDALILHDRLLSLFGGNGGLRDKGLLESALVRLRQHLVYRTETGIIDLAAIYTAAVLRNHPFVDGNKRTGFLLGVLFLELNGCRFAASEADAANAVLALAAGDITQDDYAAFLRANTAAP